MPHMMLVRVAEDRHLATWTEIQVDSGRGVVLVFAVNVVLMIRSPSKIRWLRQGTKYPNLLVLFR